MFPPDYFAARQAFRNLATKHGWALEAHAISAKGPDGEELTLDVAAHGPAGPKVLVVSSGVHGVEAAFGSAVQLALLEQWKASPPVRCVFVHAVNPWGWAHRRRANEDNADLNRNFLLPGQEFRGSPAGYAQLSPLLNPPHAPAGFDPFPLRAGWAVLRHGMAKLKQAIATGQYDHPKGLFFGWHAPAESVRVLSHQWERWLADSADVVHLDFHTGLGKWGTHTLLLDVEPTAGQREWLTARYGQGGFFVCDPRRVAYDARGGFGPWCHARRRERAYLFACAEFGTYGPVRMVGALRAENMAHHWGEPTDPATVRAKAALVEAFCPESAKWRQQAVAAGVKLAEQAFAQSVGTTPITGVGNLAD
jgi:hypothetical protein